MSKADDTRQAMSERERFRAALTFGEPDRVPLQPGQPRESTLRTWHRQGLAEGVDWYGQLMRVLGIAYETPTSPRAELDVSFIMIPTFE